MGGDDVYGRTDGPRAGDIIVVLDPRRRVLGRAPQESDEGMGGFRGWRDRGKNDRADEHVLPVHAILSADGPEEVVVARVVVRADVEVAIAVQIGSQAAAAGVREVSRARRREVPQQPRD